MPRLYQLHIYICKQLTLTIDGWHLVSFDLAGGGPLCLPPCLTPPPSSCATSSLSHKQATYLSGPIPLGHSPQLLCQWNVYSGPLHIAFFFFFALKSILLQESKRERKKERKSLQAASLSAHPPFLATRNMWKIRWSAQTRMMEEECRSSVHN